MSNKILSNSKSLARIKVVGVGGAGGNSVNDMIEGGIGNVEFIVANTDMQDLLKSLAKTKVHLGERITKGLGAGANPEIGKLAAEEDKDKIKAFLEDTEMLFITAGMGGGTGTGAAPIIAKIAKEMGILTIAVITKPFTFEGPKRSKNAALGVKELSENVDTLVIVPNDKLFELPNKDISLVNAFEEANKILKLGIKGIADLITVQGFINLDYADIKTIMANSGLAMLGFGAAEGEGRAKKATELALASPLLERPITGAGRILLNVTGGKNLGLKEANEIALLITAAAGESTAEVIFGTVFDEKLENEINVTVIATDFASDIAPKININMNPPISMTRPTNNFEVKTSNPGLMFNEKNSADEYDLLDIPAFTRRVSKK